MNIYYKDEINTLRKKKIRVKTEEVEIKMDKKRTIKEGYDEDHAIIVDDYYEIYYYNGKKCSNIKDLEHDEKICNIIHESEIRKYDYEYKVISITIDNLYYIDDGKTVFYKKKEKEELKHEKKYSINYVNIYYKEEINTLRKKKIITWKERVELKLEHKINKIIDNNDKTIINVEEYDIEKKFINDELVKARDEIKLNLKRYTESNIDRIIEYQEKEFVKDVKHIFSTNEHVYNIYNIKKIIYKDGRSEKIRNYLKQEINRYD